MSRVCTAFLYVLAFTYLSEINGVLSLVGLCMIWIYKYRDKTVLLLIAVLLMAGLIRIENSGYSHQGVITQLLKKSIVIESDGSRTLVTNCSLRSYDSVIQVEGAFIKIESAPTSYGFNFKEWAYQNKISHSIYATSCQLIESKTTPRSILQTYIDKNMQETDILYKMIFNVTSQDDAFVDTLGSMGFPLIGLIFLLKKLLRFFLYEPAVTKVELILLLLSCVVNGFSFVPVRMLLSFICRFLPLDSTEKTGAFGFSCFLLFPHAIQSLAFIIPFGFRLISNTVSHKKLGRWFFLVIVQSVYFSQVQLLSIFFYSILVVLQGLVYVLSCIDLIFTNVDFTEWMTCMLIPIKYLTAFPLYGNAKGGGLLLYWLCVRCVPRYKLQTAFILFLLFLKLGLFHPFTEITLIQIGQGDSILVREPIHNRTFLIDTGQSKNYDYLYMILRAKSVEVIDILFISHDDSDHSGNVEQLQRDFTIKRVVRGDENVLESTIHITNLNKNNYDNANDNSLVHLVEINQLKILLMGDAGKGVEEEIFSQRKTFPVDVLKIGHHGSNTSTSRYFLAKTQPKLALISSGLNNQYNHPHPETLENLNNQKISWLDTQKDGDISIILTSFHNFVITNSRKIGIIRKW